MRYPNEKDAAEFASLSNMELTALANLMNFTANHKMRAGDDGDGDKAKAIRDLAVKTMQQRGHKVQWR